MSGERANSESLGRYRMIVIIINFRMSHLVEKDSLNIPINLFVGAEFSKSDNHSAGGISIRFPRVTRIRNDKDWNSATSLAELKVGREQLENNGFS